MARIDMVNIYGQHFAVKDEEVARSFEKRGIAERVTSGTSAKQGRAAAKRERADADDETDYQSIMKFITNPSASEFAHLVPAISGVSPEEAAAAQIIEAGETARAGGPERPAPSGLAAKILAAGRKARGE